MRPCLQTICGLLPHAPGLDVLVQRGRVGIEPSATRRGLGEALISPRLHSREALTIIGLPCLTCRPYALALKAIGAFAGMTKCPRQTT